MYFSPKIKLTFIFKYAILKKEVLAMSHLMFFVYMVCVSFIAVLVDKATKNFDLGLAVALGFGLVVLCTNEICLAIKKK